MNKNSLFLVLFILLAIPVFSVLAVTGTINSTYKYAWSNQLGWINFGCDNCGVQVTDTAITGYAWSRNYGWINLNPTKSGIANSAGTLSGYAWGKNFGWVNFSGVTINSSGKFTGTASGDVIGTLTFNCDNCDVRTSWTPVGVPYCGDGVCNGTDTCKTCEADCGVCPPPGGPGSHNECNAQEQCISVSGSGTDQCSSSNDCATHNICNAQGQCVSASGVGTDQCQTDSNCVVTHNECNAQKQCVAVSGAGINQCQGNIDCQPTSHNECNARKQCVVINGVGLDLCQTNNDCLNTHNECNAQKQCVVVNGIGNNQCMSNFDCAFSHTECNAQKQCVVVSGLGIDECQTNDSCQPNRHNICNARNQCVAIEGVGSDMCQTNEDCSVDHNECVAEKCVLVEGIGIDQCQTDINCRIEKHNECSAQKKCVVINGAGLDLCQTNADCSIFHNECNGPQCVSVAGVGVNQCNNNNDCYIPRHNECNSQRCVIVDGVGSDQCQTDKDCGGEVPGVPGGPGIIDTIVGGTTTIITETAKKVEEIAKVVQEQIPESVKVVAEQTKKVVNSAQGSVVTKTVSTAGFVVGTVATATSLFSFSFFEIFLIPLRLFGLLMTAFGLKKRVVPWGVVYDSVTKQPLDPAFVVLKNLQGEEVSSAITDVDGRYGFLVDPGVYQIQARKTNYVFPSQKIAGKTHDELHSDLYFGESIEIKTYGGVITKNIPLDPIKFDWNEFAKKDKNLMKFYSKWDIVLRKIYDLFFVVGFIVAVIAYIFAPYPYNAIIVALYVFMLLLRVLGLKPKSYGYIIDKATGVPLSFAIIRIMLPYSHIEITSKSADKYGKYYCLVPPGKYYVKIEKKNDDGSYTLVYTSPDIDVSKKGIIKQGFKI